jgi:hypothetical protein
VDFGGAPLTEVEAIPNLKVLQEIRRLMTNRGFSRPVS